jgi:hypothetical protein
MVSESISADSKRVLPVVQVVQATVAAKFVRCVSLLLLLFVLWGRRRPQTPKSVRGKKAVGPKVAGKANLGPEGSPTCGTHVGGDRGEGGGGPGLACSSFVFCVRSSF